MVISTDRQESFLLNFMVPTVARILQLQYTIIIYNYKTIFEFFLKACKRDCKLSFSPIIYGNISYISGLINFHLNW